MTVTVVLSKIDAERALPWDHEGPHTGAEQSDYGRAIEPSVKWLTTPEPLVCQTCRGKGWWWFRTVQHDCVDCNGTGRPNVRIVSHGPVGSGKWPTRERTTEHGIVPIGPAVPIADNPDTNPGDCIVVEDGRVWLWDTNPYHEPLDITDQFGSQALIGYAHLIQPATTTTQPDLTMKDSR